jgi:hypothetical protein
MTTESDIVGLEDNDETYSFVIYYGSNPLDLTSLALTFYMKASRFAGDFSAWTTVPVKTAPTLGEMQVSIPRSQIFTAGSFWYRIDALNGSGFINTLVFGAFTVLSV